MVSNSVAVWSPSDVELASLNSIDDYLELTRDKGVVLDDATKVMGDGFVFVEDKNRLVGVPFVVVKFDFGVDKNDNRYALVWLITEGNDKFRIYDASTGILKQLTEYAEKTTKYTGLLCKSGLTRSDYEVEVNGKKQTAVTYYLATG